MEHTLGSPMQSGRRYVFNADGDPIGWVLGKPLATSSRGAVKLWHWGTSRGKQGTEATRREAIEQVVSAAEGSSQN